MLRYLGEDGHNTPFKSAIVLSTGYDVVEGMILCKPRKIDPFATGAKKLTSNFYRKALVGKWRGVLLKYEWRSTTARYLLTSVQEQRRV